MSRRGLVIDFGPQPLNRLLTALAGGGLGLLLGGYAAARLGAAREAVPWIAIGAALAIFLLLCAAFFLRRAKSRS
jgi:hypothetical protein